MDYKDTLNLPQTKFPMKAGLNEQEPARIENWNNKDLYHKILSNRDPNNKFVLHDGPPYANGNIHIGTALNKILKDFVVKVKSAEGYYSPYIPGWDCHGLPIEHRVDKELGDKKDTTSKNEIRALCREYANKWLNVQRESFKRLGVIGDWENPYITMDFDYEAITLSELYRVYKNGSVYKGSKPVYWCSHCVTALAEAEVEYASHKSHSIFVKFKLDEDALKKLDIKSDVSAVIWTTTPWTLPANMAVSVHPDEMYSIVMVDSVVEQDKDGKLIHNNLKGGELILIAQPFLDDSIGDKPLREKLNVKEWHEINSFSGKTLEHLNTIHPFYSKKSMIINGEHVLMTDGTGLVHTAPGHGPDDYIVGNKYGIEVFNPVDDHGKFKKDLPLFGGMDIIKSNTEIIHLMHDNGSLISESALIHSYPHCWRCKSPVIYRSTPQWFISMKHNDLRERAMDLINNSIKFIPSWGSNRIGSMVENRPDWCISRQRSWGVPIAFFTCNDCDQIIINDEIEKKVLDSFKKSGADAWFDNDTEYYLGKDPKCPKCGSNNIKKETDILDVWFDSGTSHAAVCEARSELGKADMYLEGSDQHRGWFQSSLLESIASRGVAPFKEVLTHGFVVDGKMKKMAKSVGNVILPETLIDKYGAEIMRLWVAGEDYTGDIRVSEEILKRQVESYRKIRNTMRYLLGNLYDFNPDTEAVKFEDMMELDRYILIKLQETLNKIYAGYSAYQFHMFYHTFINFCVNDLSALYLDILKDRLYSEKPKSKKRKSAQTALFIIVKSITIAMAPILSFTADEVWENMPKWNDKKEFVFEELFQKLDLKENTELMEKVESLLAIRKNVTKKLEEARESKTIGHSLDACVTLKTSTKIPDIDEGLTKFFIVSEINIVNKNEDHENGIDISVDRSTSEKCERCWVKDNTVIKRDNDSHLCGRCNTVLHEG